MAKRVAGALATATAVVQGARISRSQATGSKTIAGVPVLNYDRAYQGASSAAAEEKEHWIVVAKKGASTALLEKLCASSGACERTGHPGEGGVPFFEVHATERTLEKVLAQAPEELEFVEPDGTFFLDPEEGVAMPQTTPWGLDKVGVSDAAFQGVGTHIYVYDTGVRISHNDFGGRAFSAYDATLVPAVECTPTDGSCAADRQGHGTHCAGTAGGTQYGVAPRASVHSIKVLSDQGSGDFAWTIETLDWVATSGQAPAIASMSLGGRVVLEAMRVAVDAAVANGISVVVAGGNSNTDACGFSPAFVPSAITVGSTTSNDSRSSFSNYGTCTNIWAPGSSVLSAGHRGDSATATLSGTSMACPHVSGAVALLFEEDPGTAATDVLSKLIARAAEDRISGLRAGDVNFLLWVGEGEAPPPGAPCRRRLLCLR